MNKLFFFCSLFITSAVGCAQKQTYDVVSYTVPAGWQHEIKDNSVQLYTLDKPTGEYGFALIFKAVPTNENADKNFTSAWDKFVKEKVKVTGQTSLLAPSTEKGWNIISGYAYYTEGNNKGIVTLLTATGNNKTTSVVLMSNSTKKQNELNAFLATVAMNETAKPQSKTTTANTAVGNTGNIKYDVWECNCPNLSTGTQVTTKLNTVVLSPDGKYLSYMPETGLHGAITENGTWGTVIDKGHMLSLVNDKYGTKMELYKISASSMGRYPNNTAASIYKKVKPVDGLRIEGAYSSALSYYNGKTDIISRQIDPNKRPIIFFKKDGTYINEGFEFSNITRGDSYALGKGSYEIVNYSLILTTASGRRLQVAFTPVLDANPASADNAGLIINNVLFYRLNKTFVPH